MPKVQTCQRETEYSSRVCRDLTRRMEEGEEIITEFEGSGILPRNSNKALLTDERVIFLEDGFLSKESHDIPLPEVSSVTTNRGLLKGCSQIRTDTFEDDICKWFGKESAMTFSHRINEEL